MTHHYTIEIISKKLFFKATYRDRKFKKLEHIRGKLDQKLMNHLGKTIPINEDEISDFSKEWFQKVNYNIIDDNTRGQSLYTQFINEWNNFYQNRTNLKYKFTGVDGNALKQIIKHFKELSKTESEALEMWQAILTNWEQLSEFHRKQTDIKYINSKLNVIITEIRENISTGSDLSSEFKFS